MSRPLTLSIGGQPPESDPTAAASGPSTAAPTAAPAAEAAAVPAAANPPSSEALAEMYEVLKRHEETLRDLVVEVRLLYYNLSEKERRNLEAQRDPVTRQVRDLYAGQIRALEEKISRLRSGR